MKPAEYVPMSQNPLFTVIDDQLIVSCYEEKEISAVAIAQQKWKECLRNGGISLEIPKGMQHYSNVIIWTLDERGDADVYAKSSDIPNFCDRSSGSKRFERD